MAVISQSIPNLINGVSQQNPVQRNVSQAENQINFQSNIIDGLSKRAGTHFVANLISNQAIPNNCAVHWINRDADNQYVALFYNQGVKVFDLDGVLVDTKQIHFKALNAALKKYKFKINKIPSALITNLKFLDAVAKQKKKTLISTGMSTMRDISKAVKIFRKNKCNFVLMHCISEYPCPEYKLNLNMILTLKKKFKCEVGYSGHETSVSPSLFAWSLGADYIERHITLDRSMYGSDQAASIEPAGLRQLIGAVRKIELAMGDGVKRIIDAEVPIAKKLREHLDWAASQ